MWRESAAARFALPVILTFLVVGAGCNKGKKHIDAATKIHETGDIEAAVERLRAVQQDAPNSKEEKQAKQLAVVWLVAAGDQTKDLKQKRSFLGQALQWDSTSGAAQVRICELHDQANEMALLDKCVNQYLTGKTGVPEDRAKPLRERLERHRLLVSSRIEDWRQLVERFPKSREANLAAEKTRRAMSICADADAIYPVLRREAKSAVGVGDQLRAKNRASGKTPLELIRNEADVGRDCEASAKGLSELAEGIRKRKALTAEEPLRVELVKAYNMLETLNKQFASLLKANDVKKYVGFLVLVKELKPEDAIVRLATEHASKCKGILADHPELIRRTEDSTTKAAETLAKTAEAKTRESDGATMLLIPAGPFTRGSSAGEGDPDESPQKQVTLSTFWIDKTEVTVAQYKKCFEAKGCKPASAKERFCNWGKESQNEHPINCVRWDQAEAYCKWAGARLPTEAEWEKAARGGDGRTYPWGNQNPSCDVAVWFDPDTESHACGHLGTWRVGSKPNGASPFGALDMAGNVWEWVADGYDPGFYASAPDTDPQGPKDARFRIMRGGGFGNDGDGKLRSAERFKFFGGNVTSGIGFRCAVSKE